MRYLILILFVLSIQSSEAKPKDNSFSSFKAVIKVQTSLNANNISTWVWNTGVFNQDLRMNNTPGFSWGPKEEPGVTNPKFAIFTTGLSIGAYVNGDLRLASISYNGEYAPGYSISGIGYTDATFKLYKVSRGDNASTNPDYANWILMVPYGAPYEDINSNGVFDTGIDKPGMKNAAQTIFECITDGFPENHTTSEGFSGGTIPLYSEMHLTAWCYDNVNNMEDVQFIKMEVINKNSFNWEKIFFGVVCDPDLGEADDDYVGCDTNRKLGYCYNADDFDGTGTGRTYGANPPAVGIDLLRGSLNRNVIPNTELNMSSFTYIGHGVALVCEMDPSSNPMEAYNYLSGLKRDSTPYINPLTMQSTKYCYNGDPETSTGWTEYSGKVNNCGGATTGPIVTPSSPDDMRLVIGSGASDLTVVPGEKQTFVIAQMIAHGTNNKNAITKLKQLDDVVQSFYENNYTIGINTLSSQVPDKFSLYQNYPNPFNPSTNIKFDLVKSEYVSLKVFDISGKEISNLVNENLKAGTYEVNFAAQNLPSGIYFYQLNTGSFTQTKRMILVK